ncbi:MAG: histidinol-phosphate transaminase [Arenimonas sp.]
MRAPDFQGLAQPGIQRLRAYDPGLDLVALRRQAGEGVLVELGSNENGFGPSPRAREALLGVLHQLHRYPDPLGGDLKRALAARHALATDRLLLGNGSHELLMMLAQVFTGPGRDVVASQFGFAVYALAAQAAGATLCTAPARTSGVEQPRGHDLAAIRRLMSWRTRIVFLANPNNPTGTWFGTDELAAFLTDIPAGTLVVVDEAYIEYATDPALRSALELLDAHPNLVVTRTFSKGYGLAGLRVGYLCAHPELVAVMERVRESFNVNLPGLAACEAALGDEAHLDWVRARTTEEREWLSAQLANRGIAVPPSQANFLLADFGRDAAPIEAGLVAGGVVPRPMGGYGLPTCLRLTVGTRDENRRLLQVLDALVPEA